jgi:hypothetical protein
VPDTDLPITGKDLTVIVSYDGVVMKTVELVEVEAEKMIAVTKSKPLGTTKTLINTEIEGWRLKIKLDTSRKDASELVDLITSGEELRVPALMAITVAKKFRNFQSKSHTYIDVKLVKYSESHKREENSKEELEFETGLTRTAS